MNQASLYSKYSALQRNDALFVLNNYFQLVQWKKDDKNVILDIGCGSGEVTEDLLLPLVPKPFEKLVGVDIAKEMVEFAKINCKNSKLSFEQMDIEAEDVPMYFQEGFHHIFSFLCLQWIQNQRKGFSNILKMLKPGGDMLSTLPAYVPIYDVYKSLSKNEHWKSYMENVEIYVGPYQHSENPDTELRELLKQVGFENAFCKVENRMYVYSSVAVFKESIIAVNPFYQKIPNNLRSEYMSDYMNEIRKLNFVKGNNNEERVHLPYKLLIVYGQKPS